MAENVVPDSDHERAAAAAETDGERLPDAPADTPEPGAERSVVDEAVRLAHEWLDSAARSDAPRVADVLADADGVTFTRAFIDAVLRPDSLSAAAGGLRRLGADIPAALPWHLRGAVRVGAAVAPVLPSPVVPLSRRLLRERVAPLSVDGRPSRIGAELAALRERHGANRRIELRVPGAGIVAAADVADRLDQVTELAQRDDVSALSLPLALVCGAESVWAFDDQVDATAARLRPIVAAALAADTAITLEVELAAELDLAVAVLIRVCEDPSLERARLGIALSAALPDALPTLQELSAWARTRDLPGEAPLVVRIGMGVDPRERVDAAVNDWPLAVLDSADDIRTQAVALLNEALGPDAHGGVVLALDSTDPFLLAYAHVLGARGDRPVQLQVSAGVLPAQEAAVLAAVPDAILTAPVVRPEIRADAVAVLSALLDQREEGAAVSAALTLPDDPASRDAAADALRGAVRRAQEGAAVPGPRRLQDRAHPEAAVDTRLLRTPASGEDAGLTQEVIGIARASAATDTSPIASAEGLLFGGAPFVETAVFASREHPGGALGAPGFRNAPTSDPSTAANREWARAVIARALDGGAHADADDVGTVAPALQRADRATDAWGGLPATERSAVLRRFALLFDAQRGEFIVRGAADAGALFADADADATAVIDSANHAASLARELDAVSGAVFTPARVTAISAHGAASAAEVAAEAFAALAAGSAVILVSSPFLRGQLTLICQTLREAELPDGLVSIIEDTEWDEAETDAQVRIGARATLPPTSAATTERTPGANAVIVTPSADLERAVQDIVTGAFTRAGQAADATSLVILVGSVGRSRRFVDALIDAARSLPVGHPEDPRAAVGPLVSAADGEDLAALTDLSEGESWWLEPRRIDDRLWSPGIRGGVRAGSALHARPVAAPVLGVMTTATLAEAIELQNATGTARVAGLHTQDPDQLAHWLQGTHAAALVVNRPTTGARAQRRPVHSWTDAGTVAATGGPHHLVGFGSWRASGGGAASSTLHLRGLDARVVAIIEAAQPDLDYSSFDAVRRGALADAVAWDREFARVKDASGLRFERHLLRYRRTEVSVRAAEDAALGDIVRSLVAAVRTGSDVTLSRPVGLPAGIRHALAQQGITMFVEDDGQWIERVTHSGIRRVRLIGPDAAEVAAAVRTSLPGVTVFADDVTGAGRLELLPYLREQAISITAHRGGREDAFSSLVI